MKDTPTFRQAMGNTGSIIQLHKMYAVFVKLQIDISKTTCHYLTSGLTMERKGMAGYFSVSVLSY